MLTERDSFIKKTFASGVNPKYIPSLMKQEGFVPVSRQRIYQIAKK